MEEFDNVENLWDTIPTNLQQFNLLIEKRCSIKLREVRDVRVENKEATALSFLK